VRSYDDPAFLTADERLRTVAAILAAGVLRLHRRAALSAEALARSAPEKLSESGQDCLAVPAETVLSDHSG
jgi:hypothetical protein